MTEHSKSKKQVRQPPSVPFIWEERPGIPKKDWKPETSSVGSVPKPSPKLVASVPFIWEERPGTPLPSFSLPPPQQSLSPTPPVMLIDLPSPSAHSHNYHHADNNYEEQDLIYQSDLEIFSFKTDDSFSSAPSLLANCLVPFTAISAAVPVVDTLLTQEDEDTPSSPPSETASSTSSYATGTSSLVGESFLECLFPLFPPSSGFLRKAGENNFQAQLEPETKQYDRESNSSIVLRRPPTLGELIMMSRRRSIQRKAVQMRKQNLSMELMKNGAFGCHIFKSGSKMIEGLCRKTKQWPRLKLM